MKLRELADIKQGLKVEPQLLKKEKRPDGIYFQFLQATDFNEGVSSFIRQNELRKIEGYSPKVLLSYGDYIIYKKEGKYQFLRNENFSGQTVLGNGLIGLTAEFGILKDFLSNKKNRKYFCDELDRIERESGSLSIPLIGHIEIGTDNILELEESNKAEQIGIRQPIKVSDWPFRIAQRTITIDKLLKRIDHNELILDSEFQRRPGLWDLIIKSRLIESMILRLPLPAFYFDGTDDNRWLIIDGLQRLSAVNSFVKGEFGLEGLDYLPELEGKDFASLERTHQRNIEEFEIMGYIIEKGTPKSVTYKIFKHINTSALRLEPQEIRHAINPGVPAEFLKLIVEKEWFKKPILHTQREVDRMSDRETALRFIAFQRKRFSEYKPHISEFLDEAMTDIYEITTHKREIYLKEMESIFNVLYSVFDNHAFSRSMFDDSRQYGHNSIIFELMTYGVSILPSDKRNLLATPELKFKETVINHFISKPHRFWETDYSYTQENLRKRFEEIEQLVKKIIK